MNLQQMRHQADELGETLAMLMRLPRPESRSAKDTADEQTLTAVALGLVNHLRKQLTTGPPRPAPQKAKLAKPATP